jgi:hypothetical protein
MSKVGKTILWTTVGIVGLGLLFFCFRVWAVMFNGEDVLIKWQLRRLIDNPVAIQSVSKDKSTIQFLKHLPKNPSINSIERELDHNDQVEHFQTRINGETVDLYVRDIGWVQTFSIKKISVDGLPRLPEFYME